jgi:hypothetical protein
MVPRQADKPSSVPWRTRVAVIYLGRRLPAASSSLPGGPGRRAASRRLAPSLLLGLAPGGVCPADSITEVAGSLLHYRFTLTGRSQRSAFCCTIPSGHPAWVLPSTVLRGARTFLGWHCATRDRLACLGTYHQYNTNGNQCQPPICSKMQEAVCTPGENGPLPKNLTSQGDVG